MYYDNSRTVPAHTSRKRPRSNEEDNLRFLPNSKKFNDSDLRNIFPDSSSSSIDSVSEMQYHSTMNDAEVAISEAQSSSDGTSTLPVIQQYRPELSFIENPFYYHVNGILHEAHMWRLLRQSK